MRKRVKGVENQARHVVLRVRKILYHNKINFFLANETFDCQPFNWYGCASAALFQVKKFF